MNIIIVSYIPLKLKTLTLSLIIILIIYISALIQSNRVNKFSHSGNINYQCVLNFNFIISPCRTRHSAAQCKFSVQPRVKFYSLTALYKSAYTRHNIFFGIIRENLSQLSAKESFPSKRVRVSNGREITTTIASSFTSRRIVPFCYTVSRNEVRPLLFGRIAPKCRKRVYLCAFPFTIG